MVENLEDALQIILDNQDEANFSLDKEVEMGSMSILLPKMKSESGSGTENTRSWEETADWLKKNELIDDIPDMNKLNVNIVS
ncbi:hypothetical protein ACFFJI_01570 [Allobacillus sp. GCM10007491]|uniref:Uncharacterized protein n=2 Tax=Allobacillus TaxID=1400133 RepID=A0A941CXB8_9BACI|nr:MULTISPECIES: hypothetical protein [Allobacillus]MBR7554345.1 hypothetical protein [Allobacillus saliphilus]TSJ67726.1 hypothetical protein FPQ13_01280 [Allobacillus salarius]